MSRSGTLTYQIGNEIAQSGFGNSTIVGIGGDPIVGSSFIDIISLFEQDDETELIVMCGEIGGDEEERTADYIAENVSKPVIAYIAGFTAPPGKTMGHAGAIVSGSKGTAQAKAEALEAKGVRVGPQPHPGRRARRRDRRRPRLAGAQRISFPFPPPPPITPLTPPYSPPLRTHLLPSPPLDSLASLETSPPQSVCAAHPSVHAVSECVLARDRS